MMRVKPPKEFGWDQGGAGKFAEGYVWTIMDNQVYVSLSEFPESRSRFTDELAGRLGFDKIETNASKIARLEWEVEMLREKLGKLRTSGATWSALPEEELGESW